MDVNSHTEFERSTAMEPIEITDPYSSSTEIVLRNFAGNPRSIVGKPHSIHSTRGSNASKATETKASDPDESTIVCLRTWLPTGVAATATAATTATCGVATCSLACCLVNLRRRCFDGKQRVVQHRPQSRKSFNVLFRECLQIRAGVGEEI